MSDPLRPAPTGFAGFAIRNGLPLAPSVLAIFRRARPIANLGKMGFLVTRADDVREVFARDDVFAGPYAAKLDEVLDGGPFILGISDRRVHGDSVAALGEVFRPADLPALGDAVEAKAGAIVAAANGRLEIVDGLVRTVIFEVLLDYFGVGPPPGADMRIWSTRLFEYVFFANDAPLKTEVAQIAPKLRAHLDAEIARAKASPGGDTVLARCIARQAAGDARFTDEWIRTQVLGMIIGGPPQPPMVVPQALEQLLRRPEALAQAQAAAKAGDDDRLFACVFEAMRFDPLAPVAPRIARVATKLAAGEPYETTIPAGAKVLASIMSAMRDPRRMVDPERFDPTRPENDYIHYGEGLHLCFGRHINRATLHRLLKPLLARPNLRRAKGGAGHLTKRVLFADALTVEFD